MVFCSLVEIFLLYYKIYLWGDNVIPKFINKNSNIYLVAPSFGCTTSPYKERLEESLKNFKKLGYNVVLGDNVYKNDGVAGSNTPELRAREFNETWKSNCDAIMSVGGGETMIETLEYIDFNYIKNNPKWFSGYSDNTNLTYTITTICDIETIYGVHAASFYSYPFKYDSLDLWNMLHGEKDFSGYKSFQLNKKNDNPLAKYNFDKRTKIIANNYTNPVEGRIIGGCLDCLSTICGTKFDNTMEYIENHKNEGIIFFFEACELNSISVRRILTQLKYAGWFSNVKMFVIGRSLNYYDKSFGVSINDSYLDILKEFNVPIILDAPIGHLGPTLPIRCGGLATVEVVNNNIKISYK